MTQEDASFGIVPLCFKNGSWKVFLIQHRGGRYWGFPKGHAEENENPLEAAIRELKEETNLDCVKLFQEEPLMEQYQFIVEGRRISKRVSYFIAEVSGDVRLQQEEIQNGVWLSLPEAMHRVTYPEAKAILSGVARTLSNLSG